MGKGKGKGGKGKGKGKGDGKGKLKGKGKGKGDGKGKLKGKGDSKGPGPSVKDPTVYERLRDEGASKEKAARIANAAAAQGRSMVGRRGGEEGDYADRTVEQLRARAKELGLSGYSGKRKSELIDMLRSH